MSDSFNSLYKEFRNRLRPFQPHSIVRAAMANLRRVSAGNLENIQQAPWQILLLVKWALQDKMSNDMGTREVSQEEFDKLRQHLWAISDRMANPTVSFSLIMRRLLHQQVAFQRRISSGFAREVALLCKLDADDPLRLLFQRSTGLTPENFLDLAFATYAAIIDNKLTLPLTWFDGLRSAYGAQAINSFISLISRDYYELRAFCRCLPTNGSRVASEFFEFTPIQRFPFLRNGHTLECWHQMVFYRGMEGVVHSVMSEAGSMYIKPFSRIFEAHVMSELHSTECLILDEDELQKLVGRETQVPDALVSFPEANVFVESKAGLFDESVMVVGHADILSHKTKALRTAISQGWATSAAIRKNGLSPKKVKEAPVDYMIIVTNRELNASKGTMLQKMYPEGKLEYPDSDAERYLALERIYVLSVEDFERMISAVKNDNLNLPNFLATCVESDSNPAESKFFFEQHLTASRIRLGRSSLVTDALDKAEERLRIGLSA